MVNKNLAPWNWFKHNNIPVKKLNKSSCSDDYNHYIAHLFDEFNRDLNTYENFYSHSFPKAYFSGSSILPRVDLSDNKTEYIVEVELPGVKEKDIDLSISKDGVLNIKA